MVRQVTRRLLGGGVLAAVSTLLFAMLPITGLSVTGLSIVGAAASYAAGPDAVSLSGPGFGKPLNVSAEDSPDQFAALLGEVDWLASGPGQGSTPDPGKLGEKYVLTLFTGDKATHRYELYPAATGGPRVFRPASQPDKHDTTAAWFYGRLSMPETLRDVGTPLSGAQTGVATGGSGGGGIADKPLDPNADITSLFSRWRQVLLLNGAVVVVIAAGLAGVALLISRRVDRRYRLIASGRAAVRRVDQGRAPVRRV